MHLQWTTKTNNPLSFGWERNNFYDYFWNPDIVMANYVKNIMSLKYCIHKILFTKIWGSILQIVFLVVYVYMSLLSLQQGFFIAPVVTIVSLLEGWKQQRGNNLVSWISVKAFTPSRWSLAFSISRRNSPFFPCLA